MSINEVVEEWNELKVQLGESELCEFLERAAAEELMDAKATIPEEYLRKSGLDKVKATAELLNDRERLLYMAAYFSGKSIYGGTDVTDGIIKYDIHMLCN